MKVYAVIDLCDMGSDSTETVVGVYASLDIAKKVIKQHIKEQIEIYKEDCDDLENPKGKVFDLRKKLPIDEMLNDNLGFCYIDEGFSESDYIRILEVEVKE